MAFQLSAGTHAVAHLHRTGKVSINGEIELGGHGRSPVVWPITQILVHGRAVDDLIGVHQAVGVKRALQLLEQLVDLGAEHLFIPYAPDDAITVLAAEGTAKVLDQVADLIGDGQHLIHSVASFQADHRPDVQTANAGMAVVGGLSPVIPNNLIKPTDKVSHVAGVDRSVFNKGQRLRVTVHAHQQAKALLAYGPDARLSSAVQHVYCGVTVAETLHVILKFGGLVGQFGFCFPVELHHQDCTRVAFHKGHIRAEIGRRTGALQHVVIHDLNRRRAVL